jgi:2-methylcitrate dehydratase PrpD
MTAAATPGATRALVKRVRAIRYEEIPDEAREVARHCLLDFLGCALAGADEPLTDILVTQLAAEEGGSGAGLIGRPERATRETAALINGAAGHALDFDDTHTAMGHPSVPVIPALLALAESRDADGRAFLAALVAGIELECRLGLLCGQAHYAAGFHSTATYGTFGAAAACAHLLGLDEAAWLHAMGLAGTQAAGLKSGFGSMAKPFHAGRAASAGLLAAILARGGFTAQSAILEAEQGFAATHACNAPSAAALAAQPQHLLVRDTLFKYHAACYLTHAAIEAARRLRERHGVDPEKIERIEVQVNPTLLGVCNIQEPTTGLEGKFSLRATAALGFLGRDTGDPVLFSDATMAEPALVALRDRVTVTTTTELSLAQARLRVEGPGGSAQEIVDTGTPAGDLADQARRLGEKFRTLASPRLGPERADALAAAVHGIDRPGALAELLRLSLGRAPGVPAAAGS